MAWVPRPLFVTVAAAVLLGALTHVVIGLLLLQQWYPTAMFLGYTLRHRLMDAGWAREAGDFQCFWDHLEMYVPALVGGLAARWFAPSRAGLIAVSYAVGIVATYVAFSVYFFGVAFVFSKAFTPLVPWLGATVVFALAPTLLPRRTVKTPEALAVANP